VHKKGHKSENTCKSKRSERRQSTVFLHLSGCLEPGQNESMEEEKAETAFY